MGNIFGEGFHPNINKQVKIRQKKYGSGYTKSRTPEDILYLNGNTSWCKLASATDLGSSDNRLAKQYVLFNGTTPSHEFGPVEQRGGVGGELGAYGLGGTTHSGLAPMPGITSVSIVHENRGSLRRAELKIKAFNKEQFNIIDVLYLRLGFNILLEWGHTMYFTNNGTEDILVTNNPYTLVNDFLDGKHTYSTFLKLIQQYRIESEGNYDGFFGRVANFSWSFLKDGTYDITLKIVSIGDIIESLKANTITSPTDALIDLDSDLKQTNSEIIKKYSKANALGAWFYNQSKTLISTFEEDEALIQNGGKGVGTDYTGKTVLTSANTTGAGTGNVIGGSNTSIYDSNVNTGPGAPVPFQLNDPNKPPPVVTKADGTQYVGGSTTDFVSSIFNSRKASSPDSGGPSDVGDHYYVRLGALLNFLVNGASSLAPIIPKVGNKNGSIPLLKIDTDINRTLMYTDTYQVAVDPRICLIKKTINTNIGTLTFEDGNGPDNLGLCSDFNITIGGITYGRILNIYVNIIFIINTIKSNMDDKGKVDLYTFLKKILEGINLGLGGINDLDLIIDETTNTVHIVDNNPLPGREQFFTNKDTTIFDLYGYKPGSSSFVKDFNFETELTNELATMITVAAQYNGQIPGENSTALSRLNSGLTDRYKTLISSKISTKDYTFNPKVESENFLKILNDYFEFLQRLSKRETTIEEIDANLVKYKDILQTYDNLKNIDILKKANEVSIITNEYGFLNTNGSLFDPVQTSTVDLNTLKSSSDLLSTSTSNFTGFIPFNLQLTIDGLSGIKNIQRFLIDGEYLPRNYPNVVEFLIKNIQHDIVGNKWYTKLESYCISKGSSSSNTPKPTLTNISISSERVETNLIYQPVTSITSPFVFNYDASLSPIRNKIVEIANSYYGQMEVPGRDNQAFIDPNFEQMMKSIGWFSSPASHWCNWFTDLVWREAYKAVGASDPKIQNIFQTILKGKVLPPLTAGVFRTLDAAVKLGFGKNYGGIFVKNPKFIMPIPGDMIVYSSGHINICVSVDKGNRTFATIGGNEGYNNILTRNGAKVAYNPQYWSTVLISGVLSVIE